MCIGSIMLWAVWMFAPIIVLSPREANATGSRWLKYLELPRAEKRKLPGLAGDEE